MKPMYEMTEGERKAYLKQQDVEIRQAEMSVIDAIQEIYPTLSAENKKKALEIIKMLSTPKNI